MSPLLKTGRMLGCILAITLIAVACAPAPTAAPTPAPPTQGAATAPTSAPTTAPTKAATTAPTSAPTTAPTTAATTAATSAATSAATTTTGGLRTPEAAALAAAGGSKIGGTVNVMAVWGGTELDNFNAVIKPFQDATGVTIQYEGTRDLTAVLTTRIKGGNPPELAGIPGPGQMKEWANQGSMVALDNILDMSAMKQQYDKGWLDLTTVNGKTYGIFTKGSAKSLIWYNPKTFKAAGYTIPTTWNDLLALTDKIRNDGKTPWCIGLESGAASGWPGKDWISDILLHQSGTDLYDKWWQHQISWTDPGVKSAWTEWGKIIGNEKNVYGGKQGMLSTNFGESPFPLFSNPPGCYLHHQADFITSFILTQFPNLKPGEDFDFFQTPPMTGQGTPMMTAGDLFGMFKDTPQSRALIRYLSTAEAQSIWAGKGGYLSANKMVPVSAYPDPLTKHIAQVLNQASVTRFGAGDLMPDAVTFTKGVLDYVQNPGNLDTILNQIETSAKSAYK